MYLFPIKPKIALIRLGLVAGVAVACAEPKSPTPATPVLPPVTVTPHLFIQRGFSAEQNALNKQVKALEKELATTRQQQDAIQARMDGLLKETQEAGKTRAERDALQADLAKNQNRMEGLEVDLERLETSAYTDLRRQREEQAHLEAERDGLKDELAAQADRLTELAQQHQRASALTTDLAEMKKAYATLEKQAKQASSALVANETLKKELKATLELTEAGLTDFPPPLPDRAMSQKLEKLQTSLATAEKALATQKMQTADHAMVKKQAAQTQEQLREAKQALDQRAEEAALQQERIAKMEQALQKEAAQRTQVEAQLHAAKQKPTPAVVPSPVSPDNPVPVAVYEEQVAQGDQLRSEDPIAAASAYQLALSTNPEGVQAHLGLASVAYTQSNFSDCLSHLTAVLNRQPDHAGGVGLKGLALGALSRHPEAITAAQRALKLAPKEARIHHYAGVVHYGAGHLAQATRYFEQTTALDATYNEAWYNLAWLYVQEEPARKDLAKTAYKKWQSLGGNPDSLLEAALK